MYTGDTGVESLGNESCMGCCHGDVECKWRQLSWHSNSEFPPPSWGNRGVFLHVFLSTFSLPPEMCHSSIFSLSLKTPPLSLLPLPFILQPPSHTPIPLTSPEKFPCVMKTNVCLFWGRGGGFLPYCPSIEPATGALGEEALHHCMKQFLLWCQAGTMCSARLLSFPEACYPGGVPQVQYKHSTWIDTEQRFRRAFITGNNLVSSNNSKSRCWQILTAVNIMLESAG